MKNSWWSRLSNGTTLTKLIFVNVAVFVLISVANTLLMLFGVSDAWNNYLYMPSAWQMLVKRLWTVVTYMFVHKDFSHLFFNMLCLYWFGRIALNTLTQKQLVGVYVWGGLGGALLYALAYNLLPYFAAQTSCVYLLGASGAITAVIVVAAMMMPEYRIRLLFVGEVALKWAAIAVVAVSFFGISGSNAGGELAHLGGAAMGALYAWLLRKDVDLSAPVSRVIDWFVNLSRPRKQRKADFRRQPKTDAEYNQERARREADIDTILDKIKRSGYQSLTDDERDTLFQTKR